MHLTALVTAFGLIFLAELPDKTAYTVLVLASRRPPAPVLFGSWAAFFVQGLVALALGTVLGRLPPQAVRYGAAAVCLAFGLVFLLRDEAPEEERPHAPHRAFVEAFLLVFVAELGDATQLGTAALVARFPDSHWQVFAGAALALFSVSALAVLAGALVGAKLPRKPLRKLAGVAFLVFAVISALTG